MNAQTISTCDTVSGMETNQPIKMKKKDGVFITAEQDFAVLHDSRNYWIVTSIIDGEIQYGSLDSTFINGTYRDAVNYISVLRNSI